MSSSTSRIAISARVRFNKLANKIQSNSHKKPRPSSYAFYNPQQQTKMVTKNKNKYKQPSNVNSLLSSNNQNRTRRNHIPSLSHQINQWHIVRGDRIQVIDMKHPEYGKQGIVTEVIRKSHRLIVENVNMGVKHIKGNPTKNISGRTIQVERSIPYSAVSLLDPISNTPTKITYKYLADEQQQQQEEENDNAGDNSNHDGDDNNKKKVMKRSRTKVRISKKSGAIIPKPTILKQRKRPISSNVTESCTNEDDVWEITYDPNNETVNILEDVEDAA